MSPVVVILFVVVGASLGLLGGGGSILTVPILVYVAGLEPRDAIATSLLVVGVTSFVAMIGHRRRGAVDVRAGLAFGVTSMVGSFVGGRISHLLPGSVLLGTLAVVMFVAALAMMRRRTVDDDAARLPAGLARTIPVGVAIGALTGLVGAGGGFVVVPALVLLSRMPVRTAVGTSLLVISMNSIAGLAGAMGTATIQWPFALTLTFVSVVASLGGAALAARLDASLLRKLFAWLVLGMAVFTATKQLVPMF
jgi:hypothetical protein